MEGTHGDTKAAQASGGVCITRWSAKECHALVSKPREVLHHGARAPQVVHGHGGCCALDGWGVEEHGGKTVWQDAGE